jgi:DNA-directed RNA polymerase II subunit RPB1
MSKLCLKVKRCGHDTVDGCGAKMPDKVSKPDDGTIRIQLTWKELAGEGRSLEEGANNGRETIFSAEDVLRVLRRISDVDSEALGFSVQHNRPEWMICTCLPVPPPAVRPSVRQESGQRQEDDLTHKLADILKTNNLIRDRIQKDGASFVAIESMPIYVPTLQYHVATLIDNSIPSMYPAKDRVGRMLRTLMERLRHKEGRIRGNLMGKRVDFSARTVITPDPKLSIDELGVPLKIAMNLTFPEVVGPINRDELQRLVDGEERGAVEQVLRVGADDAAVAVEKFPTFLHN